MADNKDPEDESLGSEDSSDDSDEIITRGFQFDISATCSVDDIDNPFELFEELADMDYPELFTFHLVDTSQKDISDCVFLVSDYLPQSESPEQLKPNSLFVTSSGEELEITSSYYTDNREEFELFFNAILTHSELIVNDFTIHAVTEEDVTTFSFDPELPSGFDYKGVRLREEQFDFIVQSFETITEDGEVEATSIRAEIIEEFTVSDIGALHEQKPNELVDALEEVFDV